MTRKSLPDDATLGQMCRFAGYPSAARAFAGVALNRPLRNAWTAFFEFDRHLGFDGRTFKAPVKLTKPASFSLAIPAQG